LIAQDPRIKTETPNGRAQSRPFCFQTAGDLQSNQELARVQPMTPEELKRTMDFIVEHQAKFEANIQMLFEADQQQREADERLRQSQATLTAALVRVTEIVEDLAESQKSTDDRLNALINIVERHVSGPGHGHPAQ
jgi:hypothetical protein